MEAFKRDLATLTPEAIFRRHIILRQSAVINEDYHFALKEEVSDHFRVNFTDVVMVGSAKLGFSIKPSRRWGDFGDTSDIDLAIVSAPLFEKFWSELHRYFSQGGYWPKKDKFLPKFFEGWIRPDLFPPGGSFDASRDWWEFFNGLGASGKFSSVRIRAGLYHSWPFLESYQCTCIRECQAELS
ncbi:MAG TPA: hypothetical protein V6D20_05460 [Candidatus Obscuribacterales bacterium]